MKQPTKPADATVPERATLTVTPDYLIEALTYNGQAKAYLLAEATRLARAFKGEQVVRVEAVDSSECGHPGMG